MNIIALTSLFLSPILFFAYTVDEFEFVKTMAMNMGMLIILGIYLLENSFWKIDADLLDASKDTTSAGWLLFIVSTVLSTVNSVSIRTSLLGNHQSFTTLLTLLSYPILYFTLKKFCKHTENIKMIASIGIIAATVVAVYSCIQVVGMDSTAWQSFVTEKYFIRPFGTMGHPIFMSTYLLIILPFVLVMTKYLRFILTPLFLFCIACSGSRGTWVALIVSTIIFNYGIFKLGFETVARFSVSVLGIAIIYILMCLSLDHSATQSFAIALLQRFGSIFHLDTRYYYWKAGLETFWKYPWVGAGLDTYQIMFNRWRTDAYWQVEALGSPHKAHNEVIQIMATQGLLGITAIVVILWGALKDFKHSWRRALDGRERLLFLAIGTSIIGYCVQVFSSFNVVANGSFFVACIAMLGGFRRIREGSIR